MRERFGAARSAVWGSAARAAQGQAPRQCSGGTTPPFLHPPSQNAGEIIGSKFGNGCPLQFHDQLSRKLVFTRRFLDKVGPEIPKLCVRFATHSQHSVASLIGTPLLSQA